MRLRTGHRLTLVTLTCLSLLGSLPSIAAPSVQAGFSPEGSAEQLVLKTIETAQHNIRLMGYSFTSPEVVRALISAKRRGVDVKVVLDEKGNRGKASVAAMNLLVKDKLSELADEEGITQAQMLERLIESELKRRNSL